MKFKTIKRIKDIVERVIVYGGLVVLLNYFTPPIRVSAQLNSLRKHINDRRIQQVCRTDLHLEEIAEGIDTKNCGPLPLVKSAHALAAKWLSYKLYDKKDSFKEKQKALETGMADCSYFAGFTYSNFLYLADRLRRPDLKDKVRLCKGDSADERHAWLQVYHNGKWSNYETTVDFLDGEDSMNFRFLNIIPNRIFLSDSDDYQTFSHVQFKDGKLVNVIDFLSAFKYGKGLWW